MPLYPLTLFLLRHLVVIDSLTAEVLVVLHCKAGPEDILRAFMHAWKAAVSGTQPSWAAVCVYREFGKGFPLITERTTFGDVSGDKHRRVIGHSSGKDSRGSGGMGAGAWPRSSHVSVSSNT